MSLENHPARNNPEGPADLDGPAHAPADYWNALINEAAAAKHLGLKVRTMQGFRHRGGGPQYVRISSRCLRYRRVDLRDWADARVRTSTSDPGRGAN